jgi:hypothetical protein
MIEREWLKNLAKAKFENGQWSVAEMPSKEPHLIFEHFLSSIEDAIDIFNHYSDRPIGVFPLQGETPSSQSGTLIVRGHIQIKLFFEVFENKPRITGKTFTMESFALKETNLPVMTSEIDAFGATLWRTANNKLWNTEQYIRKILLYILEKST